MKKQFRTNRRRQSVFFNRPLAVLCLVVAALFARPTQVHVRAYTGLDFSAVGLEPTRGYFSQFPFERVDMITGDLALTFTNLVLPGNAGMDLQLEWTWSPWQSVEVRTRRRADVD